jgi:hypothetical protein
MQGCYSISHTYKGALVYILQYRYGYYSYILQYTYRHVQDRRGKEIAYRYRYRQVGHSRGSSGNRGFVTGLA